MPILKARLGEFTAIEHAEDSVKRLVRPVLEVPLLEVLPDAVFPGDARRFYARVTEHVPGGITICVDTSHLATRFGPKTASSAPTPSR